MPPTLVLVGGAGLCLSVAVLAGAFASVFQRRAKRGVVGARKRRSCCSLMLRLTCCCCCGAPALIAIYEASSSSATLNSHDARASVTRVRHPRISNFSLRESGRKVRRHRHSTAEKFRDIAAVLLAIHDYVHKDTLDRLKRERRRKLMAKNLTVARFAKRLSRAKAGGVRV